MRQADRCRGSPVILSPDARGLPAAGQGDSLEAILKDLQTYDTSDVGPAMRLHAYVFSHKDNARSRTETEAALLKFIQGSPAPAGLMAACRALSLIGGPESVPVLAALALKPGTTDAARYALERIPGPEADGALVAALDKTQGDVRRGIVFSLGARKSAAAVPALARLAAGKDAALAADAVKALGKIGGPEAVKALTAALGKGGSRSQVRDRLGPPAGRGGCPGPPGTRPRPRPSMTGSSRPTSPRSPDRPHSKARSPPVPTRRAPSSKP